jgi:hypothetical protein
LRVFQRLQGFLNTFFVKWWHFKSDVRLFKTFKEKLRLFPVMLGILNDFEAFEAFIKITRLFEDIFR